MTTILISYNLLKCVVRLRALCSNFGTSVLRYFNFTVVLFKLNDCNNSKQCPGH